MQNATEPTMNGASEAPQPTIATALEQIETIKGSYRHAIQGLNTLTDTLKAVHREQRASEKEVQSVRATLNRLQGVKL